MNDTEKKLANINDQRGAEMEEVLPQYCMIAPTVDEVLEHKDNSIACANRS